METVGAALDGGVELTSGGVTELRIELVRQKVKFSTASFGTAISAPVTDLLLLSTPSTVKLLSRGRCPPTEGPVPSPIALAWVTPGLNNDRFNTPAPTPPAEVMPRSWE